MEQPRKNLSNNVFIGDHTWDDLLVGSFNIFLGDGAGQGLKESHNQLIIKVNGYIVKKTITAEQYQQFCNMINGAEIKKIGRQISPYFRPMP